MLQRLNTISNVFVERTKLLDIKACIDTHLYSEDHICLSSDHPRVVLVINSHGEDSNIMGNTTEMTIILGQLLKNAYEIYDKAGGNLCYL